MRARAAAAVGAAALAIGVLPVPAGAVDGCPGVLVVVEYRDVGGGTQAGCATSPSSGIDALRRAGFTPTLGTGSYAGGFVCAIGGAPASGCGAVDQDTYWSYWFMAPGTSHWTYSQSGAASRRPQRGGIEAWVWQAGGAVEPPTPRSAVAAPASTVAPGAVPTRRPTPEPTRPAATAGAASPTQAGPLGAATQPPGVVTRSPIGSPTGSATQVSVQALGQAQPSPRRAGRAVERSGLPRWTGLAGLGVALLIGADAVRRTRRRPGGAG